MISGASAIASGPDNEHGDAQGIFAALRGANMNNEQHSHLRGSSSR